MPICNPILLEKIMIRTMHPPIALDTNKSTCGMTITILRACLILLKGFNHVDFLGHGSIRQNLLGTLSMALCNTAGRYLKISWWKNNSIFIWRLKWYFHNNITISSNATEIKTIITCKSSSYQKENQKHFMKMIVTLICMHFLIYKIYLMLYNSNQLSLSNNFQPQAILSLTKPSLGGYFWGKLHRK